MLRNHGFCLENGFLVSGLVFINFNFIKNEGYQNRLPPILSKQNLYDQGWLIFKQNEEQCFERLSDFCLIKNDVTKTKVYAFSDSHLAAMSPQLITSLGNDFDYMEANISGCPFVIDVDKYKNNGNKDELCNSAFQSKRYSSIDDKESIVLIGGRFQLYLSLVLFDNKEGGVEGGKWWATFKALNGSTFEESFVKIINKLTTKGHEVVLVYPIPEVGVHVPNYIFNSIKGKDLSKMKSSFQPLNTSYDVYMERSKSTFELFDSIQNPNIYRVYPHTLFCDNQVKGRCVTHDDRDVYYADNNHPSARGSEMIVELIMEKVKEAERNIR